MAERPLECGECKKPATVRYTEIVGDNVIEMNMCSDCPALQRKLHISKNVPCESCTEGTLTGLCCGNCGTNLESVKMGNPLGCPQCYEVFADSIIQELLKSRKLAQNISIGRRSDPLHVGRSLGESTTISPSVRLIALNEALSETLKKEDYEQAAWLRDQIKEITKDNTHEGQQPPSP